MANFTNYSEIWVLNNLLRNDPVYIGIVTDDATPAQLETGDMTNEVSGYTGSRPEFTSDVPAPDATNGGHFIENDAVIEYTNMPGANIAYTFLSDSPTPGAGNMLTWQNVKDGGGNNVVRTVEEGGILRISVGDARFRVD